MKLYSMIGYKLFRIDPEDQSVHMIRIVGMKKPFKITKDTKDPSEITIHDYDDGENKKVRVDSLKEYSPLKPDAVLTASIVNMTSSNGKTSKDVIVTATKFVNIELKLRALPYAVCRQSITDVFNNLVSTSEDDMLVGLSINEEDCPANFDYRVMFAADQIIYSDFINFYRTDTLEELYPMLKLAKYNEVLTNLFEEHIKAIKKPELVFKDEHGGWCKSLQILLKQNNFQTDINQMLGITQVDFNITDYIENVPVPNNDEGLTYQIARDDFRYWLSATYNVNIQEASILEYDHDIDLSKFSNTKYLLIRDNTSTLYLIVYTASGEVLAADLEAKAKEYDFSTKFKLDFYNKYN